MKKTLMTMIGIGIGAAALAAAPASAKAGGYYGWGGWNGGVKWHFTHRPHYYGGHRPYWNGGHHWKGGKCRFYYKKAKFTGKHHWWKKYKWCMAHQYH